MPGFNLDRICSAGLRYVVADQNGKTWAFDLMPERKDGAWALNKSLHCPSESGETYHNHLTMMHAYIARGREFALPVSNLPFKITWNDEPYDLVEHGFMRECDLKKWE